MVKKRGRKWTTIACLLVATTASLALVGFGRAKYIWLDDGHIQEIFYEFGITFFERDVAPPWQLPKPIAIKRSSERRLFDDGHDQEFQTNRAVVLLLQWSGIEESFGFSDKNIYYNGIQFLLDTAHSNDRLSIESDGRMAFIVDVHGVRLFQAPLARPEK